MKNGGRYDLKERISKIQILLDASDVITQLDSLIKEVLKID